MDRTQLIYNVPHVIPIGYLIAIYYITGLHMVSIRLR
jgi:hypothetical protein